MKRLLRSAVLGVLGPALLFGCTTTTTTALADPEPDPERQPAAIAGAETPDDCVVVRGSTAFMPTASEVACLLITDSQSVHVRNFSDNVITFDWLGAPIRLAAHDRVELRVDVNASVPSTESLLESPSVPLGAIYRVGPEQSVTRAYEPDGPEAFGPVAVGMTLDEASAALAHPIAVEPNLYASAWLDNGVVISGPHLWEAYVVADPHSPAFIVVGDATGSSEIVHIVPSTGHLANCLADSHPEPAPCEWTEGLPFASTRGTSNSMELLLTSSFNIDEDPPTLSVVFDRTNPIAGAGIQRCWDRALRDDIGDDRVDNFVWEPDAIPAARMAVVRALFHCVGPQEIHRALVATTVDGWNIYEPTVKTVDSGHPCWTERYIEGFDSLEADWLQSIEDDERPIWTKACRDEFLAPQPVATSSDTLTFEDIAFERFGLFMSKEELLESLGDPLSIQEFEWGGGLVGYVLDYGDKNFEIHYDVSLLQVTGEGTCTLAGVCIGDSFDSVQGVYGVGSVSTEYLTGDETRSLDYLIPGSGYCNATFTFATELGNIERLREISARCLPD